MRQVHTKSLIKSFNNFTMRRSLMRICDDYKVFGLSSKVFADKSLTKLPIRRSNVKGSGGSTITSGDTK